MVRKWLVALAAEVGGRERPVVVFAPYAGGGAMVFREWKALADVADLYAVRAPGRETRLGEPALQSVDEIARGLLSELAPLFARPLVLFGHSLGASVVFEVARLARRHGLPSPRALVVSGRQAPRDPPREEPIAHLPREAFLEELRETGGTPPEFFAHDELIDLLLPTLRADFAAAERYTARSEPPLSCPLVIWGGEEDDEPTPAALERWTEETSGPTSTHVFPGGHFFLHDTARVLPVLRAELDRFFGRTRP